MIKVLEAIDHEQGSRSLPPSLIDVLACHREDVDLPCLPADLRTLAQVLDEVPDPRRVRRYRIGSLLALCLVAVLGGAKPVTVIARWTTPSAPGSADTPPTVSEALKAGLVDEMFLHQVPVLLGGGRPFLLFQPLPEHVRLRLVETAQAPGVTHLHYEIERWPSAPAKPRRSPTTTTATSSTEP
ncbi:dihydrofolate reductase family protein [Streptomyces sp. NPDC050619]|uniref:dihydrofolate reductase family protein n=1 Tax=Streptomyces sp. NPDC050619 TaxID=3157214 RepID=UPI00341490DD